MKLEEILRRRLNEGSSFITGFEAIEAIERLEQLQAEVAEVNEKLNGFCELFNREHDKLADAKELLKEYGKHNIHCQSLMVHPDITNCTCGFEQALKGNRK